LFLDERIAGMRFCLESVLEDLDCSFPSHGIQ
jgi:hypothetical protein